jgi:hypothetical protein
MSEGELAPLLRSRDHHLAGGEISGNIGKQRKAKSGGPGKTCGGHCSVIPSHEMDVDHAKLMKRAFGETEEKRD